VTLTVQFTDPDLRSTCNSADAIRREWGDAAPDVRTSLLVLAECADLEAYGRLPNVTPDGDLTVFKGANAVVVLELRPTGPPPGVVIREIDVRVLGGVA